MLERFSLASDPLQPQQEPNYNVREVKIQVETPNISRGYAFKKRHISKILIGNKGGSEILEGIRAS